MLNKKGNSISFGVWFQYVNRSEKEWRTYFQKYKNSGIINYFIQGTPSQLKKIIIITKGMEINIHAWVWALNRPNDEVAMNNLDWYSVNRKVKTVMTLGLMLITINGLVLSVLELENI